MSDKPDSTDPKRGPRGRHQPAGYFRGPAPERKLTEQEARERGIRDPETAERLGADRLAAEQPSPEQRALEEQAAGRQIAQAAPSGVAQPQERGEIHRSQHDADAVRDDPHAAAISHGAPSDTTDAQHETSDVGLNILIAAGAIVGGLIIIALIAVSLLTNIFARTSNAQPPGGSPIATAAPPAAVEIRVNPVSALERYRAASQEALNRYGWVDEAAGVARIPITRAMTLVTEGLLPALGPGDAAAPAP